MPKKNLIGSEELNEFNEGKDYATKQAQAKAYEDSIKGMSHEEILNRISKLTTDNYITKQKLTELESEIKECEKVLNIECTPENIVAYKSRLDKSMRTALKTIALAEEELLEESKDMPDDVRRKWLEDIINDQINTDNAEVGKV